MKRRKTDIAKPARTSARSSPNGCRMLDRFQTSKLQNTSTTTHIVALIASKNIKWDNAVIAREPPALYRTYAATMAWTKHQPSLMVCSLDMLCHASLNVGTGREAGNASGARGAGSRNTWCCVDILLCLYL